MNHPNMGKQTPAPYPPPKKLFPTLWIVLGVAGLLLALAVVGGIHVFRSVTRGSSEAIAVGNHFIGNMSRHNYQAAQALFIPQVQEKTPPSSLKDMETLVEKHHGAYVDHGEPQWNVQNWNGQTSVQLAYPVKFSKSVSTVSLVVVQTDKGYQVYDAHYDF